MDEQNQFGAPQKYIWPRYVLGGVVLGIVLAVIWMAVLVHRLRGQREDFVWPTSTNVAKPVQSITNAQTPTNGTPAH